MCSIKFAIDLILYLSQYLKENTNLLKNTVDNVRYNGCKPRGKNLLYKRSNQDYSASHFKTNGLVLFSARLCMCGQGTVAWPAECGIEAWKVVWGSEWIKQLKHEHAADATAGGSNTVFGDICNWEMKTRNVMLNMQYRNTTFAHDHRKYCRKEIMVWESWGWGDRGKTVLKCRNWAFSLLQCLEVLFELAVGMNCRKAELCWVAFYTSLFRRCDLTSLWNSYFHQKRKQNLIEVPFTLTADFQKEHHFQH